MNSIKKNLIVFLSLFALSVSSFIAPHNVKAKMARMDQAGPTLIKSTLHIRAWRMSRYWKVPNADNYWSWMPGLEFQVAGPVPDASFYTIEFTLPDGKPWTSFDVAVPALEPSRYWRIETPQPDGHMDKRGILDVGTFGFKIRFRNSLSGVDQEVYKGRFKVNKFHVGNNLPAFKNQFEFYVEQDWNLPIGYLWLDYYADQEAPPLKAAMWFRGENDATKLAAYVYYNGKQIASTKSNLGVAGSDKSLLTSGNDADPRWERWIFTWNQIRGYNTASANRSFPEAHFLYGNPGTYEIKVLREGELVRTTSFTVGQDGKIVDNGINAQNKIGGFALILSVKVLGTKDGKWDTMAWKTEAFYGNPLAGFTVP